MSVTETEEKPVNVTDTTSSDAASAGSSPAEDSSEKKTRTTAAKKKLPLKRKEPWQKKNQKGSAE